MKKAKYLLFIPVVIPLLLCYLYVKLPDGYDFPNQGIDILSIELFYNENPRNLEEDRFDFLKLLDEAESNSFMEQIYNLETSYHHPPKSAYGGYLARVTYVNGDVEIYGSHSIQRISYGTETHYGYSGFYFRNEEMFLEIFSKYVDISDYPYPSFSY